MYTKQEGGEREREGALARTHACEVNGFNDYLNGSRIDSDLLYKWLTFSALLFDTFHCV